MLLKGCLFRRVMVQASNSSLSILVATAVAALVAGFFDQEAVGHSAAADFRRHVVATGGHVVAVDDAVGTFAHGLRDAASDGTSNGLAGRLHGGKLSRLARFPPAAGAGDDAAELGHSWCSQCGETDDGQLHVDWWC